MTAPNDRARRPLGAPSDSASPASSPSALLARLEALPRGPAHWPLIRQILSLPVANAVVRHLSVQRRHDILIDRVENGAIEDFELLFHVGFSARLAFLQAVDAVAEPHSWPGRASHEKRVELVHELLPHACEATEPSSVNGRHLPPLSALLCSWPDLATARRALELGDVFADSGPGGDALRLAIDSIESDDADFSAEEILVFEAIVDQMAALDPDRLRSLALAACERELDPETRFPEPLSAWRALDIVAAGGWIPVDMIGRIAPLAEAAGRSMCRTLAAAERKDIANALGSANEPGLDARDKRAKAESTEGTEVESANPDAPPASGRAPRL
jgi:hypothetical protein